MMFASHNALYLNESEKKLYGICYPENFYVFKNIYILNNYLLKRLFNYYSISYTGLLIEDCLNRAMVNVAKSKNCARTYSYTNKETIPFVVEKFFKDNSISLDEVEYLKSNIFQWIFDIYASTSKSVNVYTKNQAVIKIILEWVNG